MYCTCPPVRWLGFIEEDDERIGRNSTVLSEIFDKVPAATTELTALPSAVAVVRAGLAQISND